ncbi:MAG: MFS transporter [Xanthomonadaceae bacterium]|nr:MFS transporter [Xanthomonadaceae bacterium]
MKNKASISVIFTTIFVDLVGFGMIIPLIGVYGRHFGGTGLELGLLGATFPLMSFIFSPIWGALSDRYGRRPILIISLFGSTLAYLGFALSHSFWAIVFTRMFAGMFAGNISAAFAYMADITTEKDRARGMGLLGAAMGLGFMLGPPIGGIAAAKISLSAPGFIAAFVCGLNAFAAIYRLPESLALEHRGKKTRSLFPFSRDRIHFVKNHPYFWTLMLINFLAIFSFSNLEQTFSLLFQTKFHYETGEAGYRTGMVLMFASVIGVFIQGYLIKKLVARFSEVTLLTSGLVFLFIGMIGFPFMPKYSAYFLICIPWAIGSGLINPTISSLTSKSAGPSEQGQALGLSQAMGSLGRVLGPFMGLTLFQNRYYLPGVIAAAMSLLALAVVPLYRSRKSQTN